MIPLGARPNPIDTGPIALTHPGRKTASAARLAPRFGLRIPPMFCRHVADVMQTPKNPCRRPR